MKLVGAVVALALVAGCSSAGSGGHVVPPPVTPSVTKSPDTIRTVARELATLDHHHADGGYLSGLQQLARRCRAHSPSDLRALATTGYHALTRPGVDGASYLSVLRSLAAGTAPNGPPVSCLTVEAALTAEVVAPTSSSKSYGGYAATTTAWAARHKSDGSHPGGYLPKLANGDDSFVIGGAGRVTTLTRNFDPPLTQQLALSSIRAQLLPGGLHSVYTLSTNQCDEVVYLSPMLGTLLSSSALGVQIELTSGHGIATHYDPALVNRALLSVNGRIGGQPCV